MSKSFEDLLKQQEEKSHDFESVLKKRSEKNSVDNKGRQQAEKTASLGDLVKMINMLVTKTMNDLSVIFYSDDGKTILKDTARKLDCPYIAYKVISRKPKGEIKPRVREDEIPELDGDRAGEIRAQKFKCVVQFDVIASVYDQAEQVMERFEELILTYAGYFKKNGIAEIFFQEQLTDESYDQYRETASIKSLRYYVEIEKQTIIFREKIDSIEVTATETE